MNANDSAKSRDDFWFDTGEDADEATKERWAVNYVRHRLTDYDDALFNQRGRVGVRDVYDMYRAAVLDAIATKYPYLKGECDRQKGGA